MRAVRTVRTGLFLARMRLQDPALGRLCDDDQRTIVNMIWPVLTAEEIAPFRELYLRHRDERPDAHGMLAPLDPPESVVRLRYLVPPPRFVESFLNKLKSYEDPGVLLIAAEWQAIRVTRFKEGEFVPPLTPEELVARAERLRVERADAVLQRSRDSQQKKRAKLCEFLARQARLHVPSPEPADVVPINMYEGPALAEEAPENPVVEVQRPANINEPAVADDETSSELEDADVPEENDDTDSLCEDAECEDEETCSDTSDSLSTEEPTEEGLAACAAEVLPTDEGVPSSGLPELVEPTLPEAVEAVSTDRCVKLVVHKSDAPENQRAPVIPAQPGTPAIYLPLPAEVLNGRMFEIRCRIRLVSED